ncbi:hypothetical protein MMC25_003296 [Agyrium rufum]|nr:hypothetical protein [Agyrium rufum]
MADTKEGDEAWRKELGIPSFEDGFIQKYLDSRDALIDQEKTNRSDQQFRASLTPLAKEACSIVAHIRQEERKTTWGGQAPGNQDGGVYPGMMFGLAREKMEQTKLWRIVSKMPKGALLHAHFDAMIDLDWLVETSIDLPGMGVAVWPSKVDDTISSATTSITAPPPVAKVKFQYLGSNASDIPGNAAAWTDDYVPGTYLPAPAVADNFPGGGREQFVRMCVSKCGISVEDSLNHHLGLNDVWLKFAACFEVIGSMLPYEPIYRAGVRRILTQLYQDGVTWVEFRNVLPYPFYKEGSTEKESDPVAMLDTFSDELEKFKASEEGRGFGGARIIWSLLRFQDKKTIIDSMTQCIEMKLEFPELICGIDLVGQEDNGQTLVELTPELFWFRKRCVEEGVEIPFFFHAGECLGDGDETDDNLFDAILLGTRRLGHAFSLYKHPLLIEQVKQKSIMIECCPISNEVLRLTSSVMAHPLPALLARGVSCSLSNDDPAILGHGKNGLTHDFWQALQGWENLGLAGLGSLAENSVRFAAYEPDQNTKEWTHDTKVGLHGTGIRAESMRQWNQAWNEFCEWIVKEYAVEFGGFDDDDSE